MKITILISLFISFNALALTPEAEKGKAAMAACMSCHNAELNPALAPPFYGVQNKYKQAFDNKQMFIQAINDWAKNPTIEKALMKRPVKKLGLMPAMPLPDDMLNNIGAYLYEENFAGPCSHWENELNNHDTSTVNRQSKEKRKGMGNGKNKGHGGNHAAMMRIKHDELCK